ncbi:MAG: glycosyltransferase involved in cell wall biosynthesis [Halioglobus sp.]|jgi:glycosyltransferase involved in cell wall biosynthesis
MNTNPLVSVVIPAFNGEPYLREALGSILNQTYQPIEIVLIDDGSTDETATMLKTLYPSVRYYYQDNAGVGAARNRGVAAASADYIAFLDADDYYCDNKLELQMGALLKHPDIDIVFGQVKQFHSPELDAQSRAVIRCPEGLMTGQLPSAMLCRRHVFDTVGPFETHWKVGQDVNWILRSMEENVPSLVLPDLIYMRRLHKSNKGITHSDAKGDRLKILKEFLDRKRFRESENEVADK